MFWLKLHIAAIVASVFDAALRVDRSVPYWPIEISRMAASGPAALWRFRVGMSLLPLTALLARTGANNILLGFAWLGLMAVVWFDDKRHWSEHMAGLYVMTAALFALGATKLGVGSIPVLGAVVFMSLFAKALKVAAIVFLESDDYTQFLTPSAIGTLHTLAQRIMLGEDVARHALTRAAFRAGGVIQWLGFVALASLF